MHEFYKIESKIESLLNGLGYSEKCHNPSIDHYGSISSEFKNQYPDFPWKKMAGMRDKLVHEYFDVKLIFFGIPFHLNCQN